MKKILITGIAGFAGSWLAELILERCKRQKRPAKLFGLVRNTTNLENIAGIKKKITLLSADIRSQKEVSKAFAICQPDEIYHLAAISDTFEESRKKVMQVNVQGTVNLLKTAANLGKQVKVLLISSGLVYGSKGHQLRPFRETDSLNPQGVYAESKLAMENEAKEFFKNPNLKIIIIRSFNHIGPRQEPGRAASDFAWQIAEIEAGRRKAEIRVGNLKAIRDFTDVRDMVRAYFLAMKKCRKMTSGEVYNISSGKGYSIRWILEKLLSFAKISIRVTIDKAKFKPVESPWIIGDFHKFKKATGWSPKIKIEKTLKDILNYWRAKI